MKNTDTISNNINKTLEIFRQFAKVSEKNDSNVTQHPFFQSNCKNNINLHTTELDTEYLIFLNKYPIDLNLKSVYTIVGELKEISIKDFTFLSLKEIKERADNFSHFLDLGLSYIGMGHVKVLSVSKKDGLFFFRNDGGSNGYEREDNYNKYKDYQPVISELISFDKVLHNLIN